MSTSTATDQAPAVHPRESALTRRLNPATVVLWRDVGVVQLELGGRRIVVSDVGPDELAALLGRGSAEPYDGIGAGADLAVVLEAEGFLTDRPQRLELAQPATAALRPDLVALTGRIGDAAPAVLHGRRDAAVAVHGTSRVTTALAGALAAAGVGWVQPVHSGEVAAADSCPGGLTPADEGRRFTAAAADAIRRCAPDVDTTAIPAGRPPDLVILTDPAPLDTEARAALHATATPHLSVAVDGNRAIVGPLVVPGVTSCLRCGDLHRAERDPAWPALAVQLASRPRRRIASDVALCLATAGVATAQALAYLDRARPDTLEATLEWQLPDWRLRRRSWPPHSACDCGSATRSAKHGRMNT